MSLQRPLRGILFVAVFFAALLPAGAHAATVVNGGFESGTLRGWQVHQATQFGNWFAYAGTETPIGAKRREQGQPALRVQAPPQGTYAAVTDAVVADTLILYQDIALEPDLDHQLHLLAYYRSYKPIAVPTPDTLSVADEALRLPNGDFQANQQFRIDVIRPDAPLESLEPADILRTVFRTRPGDPPTMVPKRLTADLSAFAGQTVRIRIANAVTEEVFNASVDDISISTSAPGQSGSRAGRRQPVLFRFGRIAANRRKGTVALRVRVWGPGLLRAKGASRSRDPSFAGRTRRLRKPIEPVTVPVALAKTVKIRLRPTLAARAILRREHRLRIKVAVTFMPTGGTAETAILPVVLKLLA